MGGAKMMEWYAFNRPVHTNAETVAEEAAGSEIEKKNLTVIFGTKWR